MASTRSGSCALGAALTRLLLRATFVGGLVVAGWLLGSAPGMALVPPDSPLSGQPDKSVVHDPEATGTELEPTAPATTAATDVVGGLAGSVDETAGSVVEQDSEATSDGHAPADRSPADQSTADQSTADRSPAAETGTSQSADAEPPEPVAATAHPTAELTAPVPELAEPAARVTGPVTELAEPAVALTEPVLTLAEPATALAEPVVELTGAVVRSSERPVPVGPAMSPEAAIQPAPVPPVKAAGTPLAPSGPVLGPLATDIALPGPATAVTAPAAFGAAETIATASETDSSTVDDLVAQGRFASPPCSSGASPTGGSGSAPALPGSNGALTPPAGPAGALVQPPVTVAPGLLAQRPSTSPD